MSSKNVLHFNKKRDIEGGWQSEQKYGMSQIS